MPSDSIFNNKDRDTEPSVHIYSTAEGESSMPFPGEAYLYWRSTPNDQWELADHEVWNTNDTPYLYNGFTGCYLMWQGFQTSQTYPPNSWEDETEVHRDYAEPDEWYYGYCTFQYR